MSNAHLIPLSFNNQAIRVSDQDGNPWFVANDVCAALGIKNPHRATAKLEPDEKGVTNLNSLGGAQDTVILSEAGVYTLALRCHGAMTPGTLPYQFRKWVTGVALPALRRGHEPHDGMLTDLSPNMRGVIGGILKGIVAKALTEALPAMIESAVNDRIGSQQHQVVHGVTAAKVLDMAGFVDRKGLKGLSKFVSGRLRAYHAEQGAVVRMAELGASRALIYDPLVSREWLASGGKKAIAQRVDERRGQGRLKLVSRGD